MTDRLIVTSCVVWSHMHGTTTHEGSTNQSEPMRHWCRNEISV